jgi:hypothetical protein
MPFGLGSMLWEERNHIPVTTKRAGILGNIFNVKVNLATTGYRVDELGTPRLPSRHNFADRYTPPLGNPAAAETGLPDLPPTFPATILFQNIISKIKLQYSHIKVCSTIEQTAPLLQKPWIRSLAQARYYHYGNIDEFI